MNKVEFLKTIDNDIKTIQNDMQRHIRNYVIEGDNRKEEWKFSIRKLARGLVVYPVIDIYYNSGVHHTITDMPLTKWDSKTEFIGFLNREVVKQ